MKSFFAWFAIVLFWALIYLPGLGDLEIKGEEWRRTLPGRTMLQNNDWLVPRSGGEPYVRKPPLINWATATSFKLTGAQNEWTARLPSVLTVLAAALGMYAFSRRWMGCQAAFVGTFFFLLSAGMVEKGRIAELEVYYIAFTGLAFAAWMAGFAGTLNRYAAWLWAGFFLGLGMLTKGPMHLLFFYAMVVGACWKTKRWKEIFSLPHFTGLALCLGLFLAWAIPFANSYGQLMGKSGWDVLEFWGDQMSSRATGKSKTSLEDWLVRGPRALVMFLPWVLFLPLWWKRKVLDAAFPETSTQKLFIGLRWGAVASFAFMIFLPSSSARYVAPLLAPVLLMIAWIVTNSASQLSANVFKTWLRIVFGLLILGTLTLLIAPWFLSGIPDYPILTWIAWIVCFGVAAGIVWLSARESGWQNLNTLLLSTGLAVSMIVACLVFAGHPLMSKKEDIRALSLEIRKAVEPNDSTLYVFDLGQVPYPFYFPEDALEIASKKELPEKGVKWLLTTEKEEIKNREWFGKRYGNVVKRDEFVSTWGDRQKGDKLVLLRFGL